MIELLYERRASLENPSTPLSDPDDWLYDALGAGESSSGIRVSREKALTYSAVWRAVTLISSTVAKLPLYVYRRAGKAKEPATAHPAYRLVRFNPNAEMNAFAFWQTLMGHVLLDGNAYAYIFRSGDAAPVELIPLAPDSTYPVRENGALMYVVKTGTEWRRLLPENVLHIKGLGYDGLCGYSVIAKARDSFGLGIGARRYQEVYLKNNARPSAIIQVPKLMKPESQRELLRQWNELHQGLDNAHRTAILTEGATLNPFSINARDSQLIETRAFEIREIANWFGLPPHKLGDSSRTAYNSLEQENQSFLDDTLDPWLVAIEQECRDKLLAEREKDSDSHLFEFLRQALVRADIGARFSAYHIAINDGIYSRDEVRSMENANAIPDGLGADFYSQLNMAPLSKQSEETPEDPPDAQQLLTITQAIVADQIPPAAAEIIIQQSFPAMPPADVSNLVKAATVFEAPEPVVSPTGGNPPEGQQTPEEPPDDGNDPTGRALASVVRPIVSTAISRVARRMGKQVIAAAGKPSKFLSVVDTAVLEFYDAFSDEAARHYELCRTVGGPECDVRESVSDELGKLQEDLRALFAKCEADALTGAVESRLTDYELSFPQLLADQLLGKTMP